MSKFSVDKSSAIHKWFLVSDLKGVFHHGAIILLNTNFCQALALRPNGSCSGAGQQQQESYWKVHKVSSGVCMFESVRKPRMYLKIKDDQCDGMVSSSWFVFLSLETLSKWSVVAEIFYLLRQNTEHFPELVLHFSKERQTNIASEAVMSI